MRDRLRTATSDLHGRVDTHFGAFELTSLHGYRAFLEASAAALLPLENTLTEAGVERLFPDWPQRSRSAAVLEDIEKVGGVCWRVPAPVPLDFGGMLGTMYVLEGSRLGAKFLRKTVSSSPVPEVARATVYLSHGEGQPLWQTFLAALERHAADLDDFAGATDAARRAFHLFDRAARLVADGVPDTSAPVAHT